MDKRGKGITVNKVNTLAQGTRISSKSFFTLKNSSHFDSANIFPFVHYELTAKGMDRERPSSERVMALTQKEELQK